MTKNLTDSSNKKIAGALLFVGGSQFTVGMIVAEAVYKNYSVSENYVSDLGVWGKPSATIFNPSVFLLGLTILISAYFIQREFRMGAITGFFVLAGLGPLGLEYFQKAHFWSMAFLFFIRSLHLFRSFLVELLQLLLTGSPRVLSDIFR